MSLARHAPEKGKKGRKKGGIVIYLTPTVAKRAAKEARAKGFATIGAWVGDAIARLVG